jgi:hypothetical protein
MLFEPETIILKHVDLKEIFSHPPGQFHKQLLRGELKDEYFNGLPGISRHLLEL